MLWSVILVFFFLVTVAVAPLGKSTSGGQKKIVNTREGVEVSRKHKKSVVEIV